MNTSTILYGLIILAACVLLRDKVPYIGRLPGDFYFSIGRAQVFAPIGSVFVIHIVISLLKSIFR